MPTVLPQTLAVGNAWVTYGQALAYSGGGTVYVAVTLGEQKDVTDLVANGKACLEIYANMDDSQHFAFGGKIRDTQSWFLLSLVSLDDAQAAEQLIYNIRDALVLPIQTHATLGNAGNVFHAQVKPNASKFLKVFRNGIWLRAHLLEAQTVSEWLVPTPPGVIA